jgi:ligand-binding SRPBCC domain-containing protein
MSIHRLIHKQHLNADLPTVWNYFSHAANLQAITPEHMNFRVTSGELPDEVYPGQIITYKVSPILGIPLFWMTEITHVEPLKRFVDEQRRGPYRMWHHEHHFEVAPEGGTLMTDIIYYELPLWLLGELGRPLFVNRQLHNIFEYRRTKIATLFP